MAVPSKSIRFFVFTSFLSSPSPVYLLDPSHLLRQVLGRLDHVRSQLGGQRAHPSRGGAQAAPQSSPGRCCRVCGGQRKSALMMAVVVSHDGDDDNDDDKERARYEKKRFTSSAREARESEIEIVFFLNYDNRMSSELDFSFLSSLSLDPRQKTRPIDGPLPPLLVRFHRLLSSQRIQTIVIYLS